MNLIAHITAKDAQRTQFYCPACKDRFDADEMDLGRDWRHSDAMRATYGSACCIHCTDDHILTDDGACVPRDRAVYSEDLDCWFSSGDEARDAESEAALAAAEWRADCAMMRGWR